MPEAPDDDTPVFASTSDPGYRTLLAMIATGKEHLETITRFDMPNFRPHPAYLREMNRHGILPAAATDQKIDPYDTERRYWESLWHSPPPDPWEDAMPLPSSAHP